MRKKMLKIVAPILVTAAVLAGCGSNDDPGPPATTSVAATSMSATAPSTGEGSVTTVDPNTASQSQIAAAFKAAGISNADKWAKEVTEYGPYTADSISPTLTKELGKYGIDDATLKAILSVLAPK
jgi:DNA uptake protein ComE-like DNA-binding protein